MNKPFPIRLKRPLAVFDIESTGDSPRADRMIELAVLRINPDGTVDERTWLVNPTVRIPVESIAVHGITDEEVADCPTFADVALDILTFFEGCDLAGFSAAYFDAHGALADARATLDVIVGQLERYPDLPRDVDALDRMFNPVDPFNVDRAGRFRWSEGEVIVNFGKKKGTKLSDLMADRLDGHSFLKWIARSDMPEDTRAVAENALRGYLPTIGGGTKQA